MGTRESIQNHEMVLSRLAKPNGAFIQIENEAYFGRCDHLHVLA